MWWSIVGLIVGIVVIIYLTILLKKSGMLVEELIRENTNIKAKKIMLSLDISSKINEIVDYCKKRKSTLSTESKCTLFIKWTELTNLMGSSSELLKSIVSFYTVGIKLDSTTIVENKKYFIEALENMFNENEEVDLESYEKAVYQLMCILFK